MSKVKSVPTVRKSRREALGLLLSAPFLAQSAFAQGNRNKPRPVVIVYNGEPDFDKIFLGQHLSKGRSDFLVIVNLTADDVCVRLEASKFEVPDKTITAHKYETFKLKSGAATGSSKVYVNPGACSKERAPKLGRANGDIIIDQ